MENFPLDSITKIHGFNAVLGNMNMKKIKLTKNKYSFVENEDGET